VARLYGDSVAPCLNIARSNALVIVSWPSSATGFVLDQSLTVTDGCSQAAFPLRDEGDRHQRQHSRAHRKQFLPAAQTVAHLSNS